jgi:hypothetical protein
MLARKTFPIGLTLALSAFFAVNAAADVTEAFGPPNFVWFAQGVATPNHIWITGDSWSQDFTSTGMTSIGSLTLSLRYNDNTMLETLDIGVTVNGHSVGTFDINPGDSSDLETYHFGAIAGMGSGQDFDIAMTALNTIDPGDGSVSLADIDRSSTARLGAVPEPSSVVLLFSAMVAAALAIRRKLQAQS